MPSLLRPYGRFANPPSPPVVLAHAGTLPSRCSHAELFPRRACPREDADRNPLPLPLSSRMRGPIPLVAHIPSHFQIFPSHHGGGNPTHPPGPSPHAPAPSPARALPEPPRPPCPSPSPPLSSKNAGTPSRHSPTAILSLPKFPIPCYPSPMKNPLPSFQPRQNLPVIPVAAGIHHSYRNTTLPPERAFSHHPHTRLHITNTINDAIKKTKRVPKTLRFTPGTPNFQPYSIP